jgi:hypothetical protein
MTEVLVPKGHKGTSGRALMPHSITSGATLPLRRKPGSLCITRRPYGSNESIFLCFQFLG